MYTYKDCKIKKEFGELTYDGKIITGGVPSLVRDVKKRLRSLNLKKKVKKNEV